MFRVVFENPFFRFLVTSIGLYLGWYCLYEFYLHTQTSFDKVVIDGLVRWAEFTLQALGYTTTDYSTADVIFREHIGIAGSKGVTIGAPCAGVVLYALFVFFCGRFPWPMEAQGVVHSSGRIFNFLSECFENCGACNHHEHQRRMVSFQS